MHAMYQKQMTEEKLRSEISQGMGNRKYKKSPCKLAVIAYSVCINGNELIHTFPTFGIFSAMTFSPFAVLFQLSRVLRI